MGLWFPGLFGIQCMALKLFLDIIKICQMLTQSLWSHTHTPMRGGVRGMRVCVSECHHVFVESVCECVCVAAGY